MLKAGKEALAEPLLALITMPEYVPALAAPGVPVSAPFVVLKLAHEGLLVMLKVRVLPLSDIVGYEVVGRAYVHGGGRYARDRRSR